MEEKVILVDEFDKEVVIEEKMKAHIDGKKHRAFSVLIFNDKNQLMLQKRSIKKYHCGGLWSNTCCGHPRPNEDIKLAAKRRLNEEMGIICEPKKMLELNYKIKFDNGLTENEYLHVFRGLYSGDPKINAEEVEDWKWICKADLDKDIKNNPQNYTFWFKIILEEFWINSSRDKDTFSNKSVLM